MALSSLNKLIPLRRKIIGARKRWIAFRLGVQFDPTSTISLSSRFYSRKRRMIRIGPETLIAFKTLLTSHDLRSGEDRPITIGRWCFIGGGSIILPGVTIGDEVIVAAGAVVDRDVPSRCIVAGSPARVIRENIVVGAFGHFPPKSSEAQHG